MTVYLNFRYRSGPDMGKCGKRGSYQKFTNRPTVDMTIPYQSAPLSISLESTNQQQLNHKNPSTYS